MTELNYSQATADLIDRMCRAVERPDYKLNKKLGAELVLKTYDLFHLPRPKKIIWCVDVFNKKFVDAAGSAWLAGSAWSAESARSARSAGSARSAWSAWSAESARSAWLARSAGSAGLARSAGSAWLARSAGSAGLARSAGSARSAWLAGSAGWTALDRDFDWFVIEHEYCKNRKDNPGNEPNLNDKKYLKYSELLLQAIEAGVGYRVEYDDVLYLVPDRICRIDEINRFHSTNGPSIYWKGGHEFFYLHGVSFAKTLWKKVVSPRVTAKTILSLTNVEQRMAALKVVGVEKILKTAKLIDKSKRGNELYLIEGVFRSPTYYLKFSCPSTGRVYVEGVKPEVGEKKDSDFAQASAFGITKEEYLSLKIEA